MILDIALIIYRFCRQMENNDHDNRPGLPFGGLFNLHPQDALQCLYEVHNHLTTFTESFKERIQIEIEYSKSLIRVSRHLNKHITPQRPSPLSYLSSAFKVEHEQRARHALELAEYLHSQIEAPCQKLLQESSASIKQAEKQLRRYYKEGQNTEEGYKKNLKKYFKVRQEWEEKLMNKITSSLVPGVSSVQMDKLKTKLMEEKGETTIYEQRYLGSLLSFNSFATEYNNQIVSSLQPLQELCLQVITVQADSLRKLIVSEINMFKNIEYDLLNISRQMESVSPQHQLQLFLKEAGPVFTSPIISIYSEGPLADNRCYEIDMKVPISSSLLEETLLRLDSPLFSWMESNKFNSTFRFCLQQAWNQFMGQPTQEFMTDLQQCIRNNKVVQNMPLDLDKTVRLNPDDIFSVAFSIVSTLGSFIQPIPLDSSKQDEILHTLTQKISVHHYYRFIAVCALQELLTFFEGQQLGQLQLSRMILVLSLLIQQSLKAKDIFVIRSVIAIMFSASSQSPIYLDPRLTALDIWNEDDFWEAVVFEAAFEEISLLPLVTKSQLREIYIMRQKNIVFSALATYCHYMAMMGCEVSQIQSIASRFSHIYGLNEEHRKDLGKMIKTSLEKYRKVEANNSEINPGSFGGEETHIAEESHTIACEDRQQIKEKGEALEEEGGKALEEEGKALEEEGLGLKLGGLAHKEEGETCNQEGLTHKEEQLGLEEEGKALEEESSKGIKSSEVDEATIQVKIENVAD